MEGTKVYVGKIPREFKKEELLALFAECGKIERVKIVNSFRNRPSTVFLTFDTPAAAQTAVAKKNNMNFMNAQLTVELARPQVPRTEKPVREAKPKRELTPEEIAAIPNSIYLGNLSFKVTEEDIRGAFAKFGAIKSIKIMGQVRRLGYGYVEFSNATEAKNALAFNGQSLNERPLRVETAKGPSERPARPPRAPRTSAPRAPRAPREPGQQGERAPRQRRERPQRRGPSDVEPSIPIDEKTVFVGGLPENVLPERIHEKLKGFGVILNIQLATVENRPKYGFVHFEKSEEAQKAVAASGQVTIDGAVIRMEAPRPRGSRRPADSSAPRAPRAPRVPRERRAPLAEPEAGVEVHVGNLPRAMNCKVIDEELRKLFAGVGAIKTIATPQFPSGDFRGFAYVTFSKVEEATAARSKTGVEVGGRAIKVTYALPAEKRAQPKA